MLIRTYCMGRGSRGTGHGVRVTGCGSRGAGHRLRGGVAALFLDELYLIIDELLTHLLIVMMMVVMMMVW